MKIDCYKKGVVLHMGQYYFIVTGNEQGKRMKVYNRTVNGEYTMAKLMEHSWWTHPCMACISEIIALSKKPMRLAWVGDYMEDDDFQGDFKVKRNIPENVVLPTKAKVWGKKVKRHQFEHEYKEVEKTWMGETQKRKVLVNPFCLNNRYLINHEQKLYVDCNDYYKQGKNLFKGDCVIHPLSLLTAVGNGRGLGDYEGMNEELVGSWAWNLISIDSKIPFEDYKKLDVVFVESC